MDYVKHFNLTDRPFRASHEARVFFRGASGAAVFAAMRDDVWPPVINLKGRTGLGKTTILKRLEVELRGSVRTVLVLNPKMTLAEILRQALTDFGHSHKFTPATPEEELLGYFQNSVADFIEAGSRILLAVDNAEDLSPRLLADLYGLMELEPGWKGRVHLLLCGSAESPWPLVPDIMLETRDLELAPLSREESDEYVATRLKAAGGTNCFNKAALKSLWDYAAGVPETINQLAERALMAAWSSGRSEVGPAQLNAARGSLDKPMSMNYDGLDKAAGGQVIRPGNSGGKSLNFRHISLLVFFLVVVGLVVHLFSSSQTPVDVVELPEPVVFETEEEPVATVTPAGKNEVSKISGVDAPALPTPPSQLLALPQGSLALVVDNDAAVGRLWQGGARGPGRKADIVAPKFKHKGLYLFGRQKGQSEPLIFQYPPARDVPHQEAKQIWHLVSTLLPQNIVPLIVASQEEFFLEQNAENEESINRRVKAWVQSQQYNFPDTMADLYASSFQFFELGRQPRTINRENFRKALNSEARTSGVVNLTTSQPLIMQDPVKSNLIWAVFNLKYESKLRRDIGIRVLVFEKTLLGQDNWLIVAELWLPEQNLQEP